MEKTQNGIKFENIYKSGGVSIGDTLIQSSFNSEEDIPSVTNFPLINAIDIDWNSANVGNNKVINTTGELISWIKDNQLSEEQKEALQYLINIIKIIQNKNNVNVNDTYFWYAGLTLPNSDNLISIALDSSNEIEHWEGKEFHITNTTAVASTVYVCTPVDFNVIWKDTNGFDMSLPNVITFKLNNIEYKVQRRGRTLPSGGDFVVVGYN